MGRKWVLLILLICNSVFADEQIALQLKWTHQFQFAGYYAALEKGYYRNAGLDVTLRPNGYTGKFTSPVDEVMSGKAQYGISNSGLILEFMRGKPIVAIAATLQHSAVSWLVLENSGIETIHDLADKRLMTVFPLAQSLELLEPFRAEGIAPEKLHLVQTVFDLEPLIKGQVDAYDAYVTNEPFLLEKMGIRYRLINPRTYGIDFYGDVLFTSQDELKNHPERVEKFRAASMAGWRYAMQHPEEIIELILHKYGSDKSREHLQYEAKIMAQLMQPDIIEIGHMNPGRWLRIAEILTEHKSTVTDETLSPFIYRGFNNQPDIARYLYITGVSSLLTLVLAAIASWIFKTNQKLKKEIQAREQAEELLRHLSETDVLTGIANRRAFETYLQNEFKHFKRYVHPFSMIMIDIDLFKKINDEYGHSVCDEVLATFAKLLHQNIRKTDFLARIGGEEFVVIMPETEIDEALITANKLKNIIGKTPCN